jgi:hypothetical protein
MQKKEGVLVDKFVKPRKKKVNQEDILCKKFWSNILYWAGLGRLNLKSIHHNNNGEHSGNKVQRIIAGLRAKEMGQLKGLYDYTAYTPSGKPIFLEFKFANNPLTKEQKEFKLFQESIGNYCYEFRARDIFDFAKVLEDAEKILRGARVIL